MHEAVASCNNMYYIKDEIYLQKGRKHSGKCFPFLIYSKAIFQKVVKNFRLFRFTAKYCMDVKILALQSILSQTCPSFYMSAVQVF